MLIQLQRVFVFGRGILYQQQGESIREYVASLRQLARKCKFGEMEEEMVRDQLIERTNNLKS